MPDPAAPLPPCKVSDCRTQAGPPAAAGPSPIPLAILLVAVAVWLACSAVVSGVLWQ